MIETILGYTLIGTYIILGLYFNYMLIRNDLRDERERKAALKKGGQHDHY